jgi:hypothetical protein
MPTEIIRCSVEENSVFPAWRFRARSVREFARTAPESQRELACAATEMAGDSENTLLLSL